MSRLQLRFLGKRGRKHLVNQPGAAVTVQVLLSLISAGNQPMNQSARFTLRPLKMLTQTASKNKRANATTAPPREVGQSCGRGCSQNRGATEALAVGGVTCAGTVHPGWDRSSTGQVNPVNVLNGCVDWLRLKHLGVPLGPVLVPRYFVAPSVTLLFNFLFIFEPKNIEKLFHLHQQPRHHMAPEMVCKNFQMYIFCLLLPRWQVVVFMGRRRFLELLNNVFLI